MKVNGRNTAILFEVSDSRTILIVGLRVYVRCCASFKISRASQAAIIEKAGARGGFIFAFRTPPSTQFTTSQSRRCVKSGALRNSPSPDRVPVRSPFEHFFLIALPGPPLFISRKRHGDAARAMAGEAVALKDANHFFIESDFCGDRLVRHYTGQPQDDCELK